MRNTKYVIWLGITALFVAVLLSVSSSITAVGQEGTPTPTGTAGPTPTPTPGFYLGEALEDVHIEHEVTSATPQAPHVYEYGTLPDVVITKPYDTWWGYGGINWEAPTVDSLIAIIYTPLWQDGNVSPQRPDKVGLPPYWVWGDSSALVNGNTYCFIKLSGNYNATNVCSEYAPGSVKIERSDNTPWTGSLSIAWGYNFDPEYFKLARITNIRLLYYGDGNPGYEGSGWEYVEGLEWVVPDDNEMFGLTWDTDNDGCDAAKMMDPERLDFEGYPIWGDTTIPLGESSCYIKLDGEYETDTMCEELKPGADVLEVADNTEWIDDVAAAWSAFSNPNEACTVDITNIRPIYFGIPPPPDVICPYLPGDTLTTYQVAANMVGGDVIPVYFTAGNFYSISITGAPWYDGDTDALSYDAEIAFIYPANPSDPTQWHPISEISGACTTGGTTYFQAPPNSTSGFYTIRARDPAGNWSNNTGDVSYTVTTATYVPGASECAMNFGYDGYHSNGRIYGNQENGIDLPIHGELEPNRWYALEIFGGPWLDNGIPKYDVQISADNGQTWVDLVNWAGSGQCFSQTGYGQSVTFFMAEVGVDYKLRVDDEPGTFGDNTGYMQWNLYFAVSMAPPAGQDCSAQFQLGDVVTSSFIRANLPDGGQIYPFHPSEIVPDNWYALEIVSPPWWDADANLLSTRADISTGPHDPLPAQWFPLESFPGASCRETIDGYYTRIYFQAQEGDDYLLRAHDGNNQWSGNTGYVNYLLYNVTPSEINPPPTGCEADFGTGYWIGGSDIEVTAEAGELIVSPVSERWYRLDTGNGPWYDDGVDSYLLDVSSDGGTTWGQLVYAPFATCIVAIDANHTRMYWRGEPGFTYKIRVDDDPGDFGNNTGSIRYDLYSVGYTPSDPGDDPGASIPPWWEGNPICYTQCVRPISGINIPGWLEYGRCKFSKLIMWCPYHTNVLTGIPDMFFSREPFYTLSAVSSLGTQIKAQFDSYSWGNDADIGGEDLVDIFTTLPENSIYNGGQIDIMPDVIYQYSTFCATQLTEVIGSKMTGPVCFVFNILDTLGLSSLMQFVYDTCLLIALFLYIMTKWIR